MAGPASISGPSGTVEFTYKPIWTDRWTFLNDVIGSDISLIGGGVVSQRIPRTSNDGKPITLQCPWITDQELSDLWDLVSDMAELTLKPEEAATTYSVVFRAVNPIEIQQVGGAFPDEDKITAGLPYNRYSVILHLIAV